MIPQNVHFGQIFITNPSSGTFLRVMKTSIDYRLLGLSLNLQCERTLNIFFEIVFSPLIQELTSRPDF